MRPKAPHEELLTTDLEDEPPPTERRPKLQQAWVDSMMIYPEAEPARNAMVMVRRESEELRFLGDLLKKV